MDDSTRPGSSPPQLRDLHQLVTQLAGEVADLRAELASEVRTHRLVVVEDDGHERVVIASRGHYGHLMVRGRSPEGRSTAVELFANDPSDGDGANVGLALTDDGDVVALFDVTQGGTPAIWITSDETPD